jgi:hypothetical protein
LWGGGLGVVDGVGLEEWDGEKEKKGIEWRVQRISMVLLRYEL